MLRLKIRIPDKAKNFDGPLVFVLTRVYCMLIDAVAPRIQNVGMGTHWIWALTLTLNF